VVDGFWGVGWVAYGGYIPLPNYAMSQHLNTALAVNVRRESYTCMLVHRIMSGLTSSTIERVMVVVPSTGIIMEGVWVASRAVS
jgi:hypothetical protein